MITLSRRPCRQFVALARRALHVSRARLAGVTVAVASGRSGPVLWASKDGVTLALGDVEAGAKPEMAVPLSLIADVMQRASELTLEPAGKQVTCRYARAGVPQVQKVPAAKDAAPFPALPALADPGDGFLEALAGCAEVTDVESSRYALGCVRLRGKEGDLAATDSKQALIRSWFHFPFAEEVLLPRPALLQSRELEGPVRVGVAGKAFVLRAGEWTVWLLTGEGRFPKVEAVIPRVEDALTELRLDPADAAFLAEHIEGLPGVSDDFFPVTLDVSGGGCLLRARGRDQDAPVEIPLPRSRASGQDVRVAVPRSNIARAVALGADVIRIQNPNRPLVAVGDRTTYVWMPLEDQAAAVGPAANAVRIEPDSHPLRAAAAVPAARTRKETMSTTQGTAVSTAAPAIAVAQETGSDLTGLIRRADAATASLSTALKEVKWLGLALRKRRKAERLVKTTLEGIRKLKTLDAAA